MTYLPALCGTLAPSSFEVRNQPPNSMRWVLDIVLMRDPYGEERGTRIRPA